MIKIAVCLQLHDVSLWPEIKKLLQPLSANIKLYLAIHGQESIESKLDLSDFEYEVSFHKDFELDVLPFLYQLNFVKEDLFIKFSTKFSLEPNDAHWNAILLNDFFGTKKTFYSNINSMVSDCSCVAVLNESLFSNTYKKSNLEEAAETIKEIYDPANLNYDLNCRSILWPAFMGRTNLFKDSLSHILFDIDCFLDCKKDAVNSHKEQLLSFSIQRIFDSMVVGEGSKVAFPNHETINILSSGAPNKKFFTLIKLYNNDCYILESPSLFGSYEEEAHSELVCINWKFNKKTYRISYIKLNNKFIKRLEDSSVYLDKDYFRELNNFCSIYNVTKEDLIKDNKIHYRYFCFRYLNYIRNLDLPEICLNSAYEAVFIEFRIFPHVEFIIRNAINKLGDKWSHTIICGKLNYNFFKDMCNSISKKIKVICLNYDFIDKNIYSEILSSRDFWSLLTGEKILIHQEDTCIFKDNIEDFLEWDYIGAPWPKEANNTSNNVGNGGLSLRSKSAMLKVIDKISLHDTEFSNAVLNHMKQDKLDTMPEDFYFVKNMEDYKIGRVASWDAAYSFSTESVLNQDSFGGHSFWNLDMNWMERLHNHIVIQFRPNYDLSMLEHRGGWGTILEDLSKNELFSPNSKIDLFDMVESKFLWNSSRICDRKWIGIVHCTQNTPPYLECVNIRNLFKNENFIKSLDFCLCMFSLSDYVTRFLEQKIKELKKTCKVYTLKHPVVSNGIIEFDYNSYLKNDNKSLLFIGQQLRKMTSFYLLNTDKNKVWLTGTRNFSKMNYLLNEEIEFLKLDPKQVNHNSVLMKYTKDYEEYDILLSKNIVFVDLFDASANNTLLECIIRNTPIIINKLPAVVEYLGEDYPLYFTDLCEVTDLINDESKILSAHKYLKNLKKEDLSICYFTKSLINHVHKHFSKGNNFNPSIFVQKEDKDVSVLLLTRHETDVINWEDSVLRYNISRLDKNFNVTESGLCSLIIKDSAYKEMYRKSLCYYMKNQIADYCVIEDVKLHDKLINGKIIGTANILIEESLFKERPRMFRVGLVELNPDRREIKLIKVFDKLSIKMNDQEKNWSLFENRNNFYLIYKLFPLTIYKLNLGTLDLELVHSGSNKLDLLCELPNLEKAYKELLFTPTPLIKKNESEYVFLGKTRTKDSYYHYYKFKLKFLSESNINIDFDATELFNGYKLYLNDVKVINDSVFGCFGVGDKDYEIRNLDNYFFL